MDAQMLFRQVSLYYQSPVVLFFPINIIKNIEVEISLRDFINNVRKARRDFLQKLYTITKGQQTQGVYLAEFAKEIGLDNFMLDRVYWYLLDQGLIDSPFIGAVSISHAGIIEVEQELTSSQSSDSQLLESHYPDVTLVDEVVERIEHLNDIARPNLGFDIFNTRAKLFIDLRKSLTQLTIDTRDEHAFVVMLLSIGSILNDIKSNEIKASIDQLPKEGSINLIQQLFDFHKIIYNKGCLNNLRILYRLRSTKTPIHSGESNFAEKVQELGIEYPITDWAAAAQTCLTVFINSLISLIISIQKT